MALFPRDGDDAESLLRAVDVALRVAKRTGISQLSVYAGDPIAGRGPGGAHDALERLIGGEGLEMAVQPIVSVPEGAVHAYEALARFRLGSSSNPLHWFALADEFAVRDRLELACLRAGLKLLDDLPEGTRLSVNLSGPLLLDPRTSDLLREHAAPRSPHPRGHREQPAGGHPRSGRRDRAAHRRGAQLRRRRHGRRLLGAAPDHRRFAPPTSSSTAR